MDPADEERSLGVELASPVEEEDLGAAKAKRAMGLVDWIGQLRAAFGAPFLAVVMIVYGVNQGYGESVKNMAINYYWKDVQKLQPSSTQAFQALSSLPWDIKPIYGLITDTFPIGGYRRWPYLATCGMAGSLCLWMLALLPTPSPLLATLLLAGAALCTAFPDVVTDAAVAQHSRNVPHLASDLQSLSWGSMAIGGLSGCGIAGPAVHSLGPKGAFLLISTAPLMLIVAAWALPEDKLPKQLAGANFAALLRTVHLFTATVRSPSIWKPALYIYLFSGAVCPDISEAMFFWMTDSKHGPGFSENFLGLVSAIGYVAMVCGILLYNTCFRFYSFRTMFKWTQVAVCLVSLPDIALVTRYNLKLGVPDHFFVLGDKALSSVIFKLQLMPMLVLSAKLCPPGVEGTVFAFLMSVSNLGGTTASWLGAWLLRLFHVKKDDYTNLWLAVVVRSIMRLLPLIFLTALVPDGGPDTLVDNGPALQVVASNQDESEAQDDLVEMKKLAKGVELGQESQLLIQSL
ncbi:probable folate-biopterin transporter 6 isoform X1 [Selaginella moellendorffii]|uniref:probable folate-biopterin transporter 6 isoform X1 n=1 Tax=Selaginella moellendorffii TaxID=88036 RepID=UPI000D1C8405|nr:probable folate-biopterin transporter 6 isoform X1 [Selaginella moellendorffii]|eukprot:XP_024517338.1 probable folate-biopterin transporter 6 isoform X1 [Selaginella moellendorffii]